MEKNSISVILPVHELNEVTLELFINAVKSVQFQTVKPEALIIVVPTGSSVIDTINKEFKDSSFESIAKITKIVENDGPTDFSSQVNFGVSKAETEWVSFLEYDDEFANIWLKNVVNYQKYYPNVGLFMPIVVDVDGSGAFIGFTNEAVWANSFSDELGLLDINALLNYQNFNIDGIVMKKSIFEEFGGFKPSIKLTFIYEFLLRMSFNDVKIMTIPKFGYKHVNQRPDSLFANLKAEIDPIESKWWLSQAKKEYYFKKDRNLTYQNQK